MYFREHNPPHFHAYYQGFEASFDINTGRKIVGKFPKKAEKIILEWSQEYKSSLLEDWELMEQGKQLKRIPGADQ